MYKLLQRRLYAIISDHGDRQSKYLASHSHLKNKTDRGFGNAAQRHWWLNVIENSCIQVILYREDIKVKIFIFRFETNWRKLERRGKSRDISQWLLGNYLWWLLGYKRRASCVSCTWLSWCHQCCTFCLLRSRKWLHMAGQRALRWLWKFYWELSAQWLELTWLLSQWRCISHLCK